MAELYSYKLGFEPIVLPGESVKIITENEQFSAQCVAVGALPEYTKDFGALTAAIWDTENQDTNLKMPENTLAQLRMRVVTDMQLRFNNLGSTRQWRTNSQSFILPQFPQEAGEDFLKEYLFAASEFFILKDDTPMFDFYSDAAQVSSTVKFSGWRFRIRKIVTTVDPTKVIWVSGWPSGD